MESKNADLTKYANIFLTYFIGFSLLFVGLSLVTKVAVPGLSIAVAFLSAFLTNIWFLKSYNRSYTTEETLSLTNKSFIRLLIVTILLLAYNIYTIAALETSISQGIQNFINTMPSSFYMVHIIVILLSYLAIYLGLSLIKKQSTGNNSQG